MWANSIFSLRQISRISHQIRFLRQISKIFDLIRFFETNFDFLRQISNFRGEFRIFETNFEFFKEKYAFWRWNCYLRSKIYQNLRDESGYTSSPQNDSPLRQTSQSERSTVATDEKPLNLSIPSILSQTTPPVNDTGLNITGTTVPSATGSNSSPTLPATTLPTMNLFPGLIDPQIRQLYLRQLTSHLPVTTGLSPPTIQETTSTGPIIPPLGGLPFVPPALFPWVNNLESNFRIHQLLLRQLSQNRSTEVTQNPKRPRVSL